MNTMAKLIPGRVRNEGIKLFEKGLIAISQVSETQLDTTVGQHHLIYALDDSEIMCDCDFFAQKGYCSHLAAVEYYLKNAKEGQRLLAKLEEKQESAQDPFIGDKYHSGMHDLLHLLCQFIHFPVLLEVVCNEFCEAFEPMGEPLRKVIHGERLFRVRCQVECRDGCDHI